MRALPRTPRRAWPLALLPLLWGCFDELEGPYPTEITLSVASPDGAVGEAFAFRYEVRGTSLSRVEVDYGDGSEDSWNLGGAVTGTRNFEHAFGEAGTYVVVARLEELAGGEATDEVTVQVQAVSGGG